MRYNLKNVVLFTGQSGIKAEDCIKNLNYPKINELKIYLFEKNFIKEEYQGYFRTFLTEPIPTQVAVWDRSFDNFHGEFSNAENSTVFLSIHASYYHQGTCELVSVINFKKILKLKDRIKMVIVLIDDIYDIYKRLLNRGEMFNKVMHYDDIYRTINESIFNLISILRWRQLEINISRLIARMINVPFYIIAIKHPVKWIRSLIIDDIDQKKIFYLAHPISAIRKSSLNVIPDFSSEVNNFAKKLVNENKDVILFLPGTIDELRIKEQNPNQKHLLSPELYPRLDLPYGPEYQITSTLQGRLKSSNVFNPPNLDISVLNEHENKKISALLHQLSDLIRLQVTSRDINLINQSKNGIIVYRPYFPGYISGGVNSEIEYNHKLAQLDRNRRSIVVSKAEDIAKARIRILFTQTLSKLGKNKVNDDLRNNLENMRENWLSDLEKIKEFSVPDEIVVNFSKYRKEIENLLLEDYFFEDFSFKNNSTFNQGYFKELKKNQDKNFQKIKEEILKDKLLNWVSKEDYHTLEPSTELNIKKLKDILDM